MIGYSNAKSRRIAGQLMELARYKLANKNAFARMKYKSFVVIRDKLEELLGRPLEGVDLLEVGCGQWLSNVKLFSAMKGVRVVGIDPEAPPLTLAAYPKFFIDCGWQRGLKTTANELVFRRSFDGELEKLSGLRLNRGQPEIHRLGGETLPVPDQSLDAVFSDNVFEHIEDVEAVVLEVRRALKPGGVAFIIIHPFAAYSGGHHPATYRHGADENDSGDVAPWDHLRSHRHPSGVYCNGVRAKTYRDIFERHLTTVEWETLGPEGEKLLTPEILSELSDYSREELLTGKILYAGRRSKN